MVLCSPTLAPCLCQGISICSDWVSIEDIVKKKRKEHILYQKRCDSAIVSGEVNCYAISGHTPQP